MAVLPVIVTLLLSSKTALLCNLSCQDKRGCLASGYIGLTAIEGLTNIFNGIYTYVTNFYKKGDRRYIHVFCFVGGYRAQAAQCFK